MFIRVAQLTFLEYLGMVNLHFLMYKLYTYCAAILTVSLIFSCKKDSSSKGSEETGIYFKGEVNGHHVEFDATANPSIYECGAAAGGVSDPPTYVYLEGTLLGQRNPNTRNSVHVLLRQIFDHPAPQVERLSMVHIGNFEYAPVVDGQLTPTTAGAIVGYFDENGRMWYSGSGPQTGSTFSISEVSEIPGSYNPNRRIFKANFSCTLYDSTGESIHISDCTLRGFVFAD